MDKEKQLSSISNNKAVYLELSPLQRFIDDDGDDDVLNEKNKNKFENHLFAKVAIRKKVRNKICSDSGGFTWLIRDSSKFRVIKNRLSFLIGWNYSFEA